MTVALLQNNLARSSMGNESNQDSSSTPSPSPVPPLENDFTCMFRDVAQSYHAGADLARLHTLTRDWRTILHRLSSRSHEVNEQLHRVERIHAREQAQATPLMLNNGMDQDGADEAVSHRKRMLDLDAERMEAEREKSKLSEKSKWVSLRRSFFKFYDFGCLYSC
jgi:hypothetical protein